MVCQDDSDDEDEDENEGSEEAAEKSSIDQSSAVAESEEEQLPLTVKTVDISLNDNSENDDSDEATEKSSIDQASTVADSEDEQLPLAVKAADISLKLEEAAPAAALTTELGNEHIGESDNGRISDNEPLDTSNNVVIEEAVLVEPIEYVNIHVAATLAENQVSVEVAAVSSSDEAAKAEVEAAPAIPDSIQPASVGMIPGEPSDIKSAAAVPEKTCDEDVTEESAEDAEGDEEKAQPVVKAPVRSMLDMLSKPKLSKKELKQKKKEKEDDDDGDGNDDSDDAEESPEDKESKKTLVPWYKGSNCEKKRKVPRKVKVKVPHFKSNLERTDSNRTVISVLTPQPPMWSSYSSLRSSLGETETDPKNQTHPSASASNLNPKNPVRSKSYTRTKLPKPKLAISRGSGVIIMDFPPWRPGYKRVSPWEPKKYEGNGGKSEGQMDSTEKAVKKILSTLPPLSTLTSQYESSDIFLHRILTAYKSRCTIIEAAKRSGAADGGSSSGGSGEKIRKNKKDGKTGDEHQYTSASPLPLVPEESDDADLGPENTDLGPESPSQSSHTSFTTPTRPVLESPSSQSPKSRLYSPSPRTPSSSRNLSSPSSGSRHYSNRNEALIYQTLPLCFTDARSPIKSILDSQDGSSSKRLYIKKNKNDKNCKNGKNLPLKKSRNVLFSPRNVPGNHSSPTKASTASEYQRKFFCAKNIPNNKLSLHPVTKSISCQTDSAD